MIRRDALTAVAAAREARTMSASGERNHARPVGTHTATSLQPGTCRPDYIAKAQPIVDDQIQKAGVRLAAALNLAFR